MESAISNRLNSLDKYKSLQQRRRRMSVVAPMNDKGNALDFEERIAICKHTISLVCLSDQNFFFLVDSDFRSGLFKLTAMLIHNIDETGEKEFSRKEFDHVCSIDEGENELRFTAIGGAPNGLSIPKGNY